MTTKSRALSDDQLIHGFKDDRNRAGGQWKTAELAIQYGSSSALEKESIQPVESLKRCKSLYVKYLSWSDPDGNLRPDRRSHVQPLTKTSP